MADDLKAPFTARLPDDLLEYAADIADQKMNAAEREMQHGSEAYPEYARALGLRDAAVEQLIQERRCDPMEVDRLESAMTAYGAALAIEMYKRGFMDGGRVCHAFMTGELPRKGAAT